MYQLHSNMKKNSLGLTENFVFADIRDKYKLTIIVPYYNDLSGLKRLLGTVPSNDWIQTLVVDDHSENDLEELENLKKQYKEIQFIQNDLGKKGAGAARNEGLKYARGEYLLFADADDFFEPEFESLVLDVIENHSNSDLIFFPPKCIMQNGELGKRHRYYVKLINQYAQDSSKRNEMMLRYQYWAPWSKMIKRELIQKNKIKFDELMYSNDLFFSAKVGYYAENIICMSDSIYCIVSHDTGLTKTRTEYALKVRDEAWCKYYFWLRLKLPYKDFKLLSFSIFTDIKYIRQWVDVIKFKIKHIIIER